MQTMTSTENVTNDKLFPSGFRLNPAVAEAREKHFLRVKNHQAKRKAVKSARDTQVHALYPRARTFQLQLADPVGMSSQEATKKELPETLTLVTPDHANPAKDHLFVGSHAVLSRDLHYDSNFEEINFRTSDGASIIRGHLRLTRSRTRAFGTIEFAGQTYAVQYQVKPQRYKMKVGKGAAYLAGTSSAPQIRWDVESDRWKNASWTSDFVEGFRYGVTGSEVIGDEVVYDFVADFDIIGSDKKWNPMQGDYVGFVNTKNELKFAVQAGVKPPLSGGTDDNLFPYIMQIKLDPFAYGFTGGMLTDKPDLSGTVYGLIGEWDGGQVAGVYHIADDPKLGYMFISVHDGQLYIDRQPVPGARMEGNLVRWDKLPTELLESGLPEKGVIRFSSNGDHIIETTFGKTGQRVHPDEVHEVAMRVRGAKALAAAHTHAATVSADPGHSLTDLVAMSQFALSDNGNYYDKIQNQSMEDFYSILQYYMDPEIRKQFFNPNPPPLSPGLFGIAQTPGTKGTDPKQWYEGLTIAYASSALSKWSDDPAAALLNGRRADAWLQNQTTVSDVMLAQGPLMYARRYKEKYDNLGWFLNDQIVNAAKYAPFIDAKVEEWVKEVKDNFTGSTNDLDKVISQIREIGQKAKDKKLYWAFAVYTYTTRPAYLNLLQAIMISGDEYDGSETTQRIQRTVAILNVLDTSSYISGQYAYVLQLFQVANILPQLMDYAGDFEDYNFAVDQIIRKFIETYINSPDPKMREAAETLQQHASREVVSQVLQILRQSSAAAGGLYNWTNLVATFESRVAKVFGSMPAIVSRLIMMGAVGLMINFFVIGKVSWSELSVDQQVFVILNGAGIVAQVGLFLVKRGIAFSEVFLAQNGIWNNFKLFFSRSLIADAQRMGASGFKGWLLETGGIEAKLENLSMRALFAETAAETAALQAEASRIITMQKIFGRNLTEFLATRVGAFVAAAGIVMSAILLAEGGTPMEVAANSLFLVASTLEFIATAGLWATQAFSIATIGGMAVGTIFAVISVIGFVAMLAGVVLMLTLLFQPQQSPVEKFAKEKAGLFYMPFKTDIDYFQEYQKDSEPQRSGVAVRLMTNPAVSLYVESNGMLAQKPFDASGHSAFYLRVDEFGRAQIGAPITDSDGKQVLMVLALDKNGNLIATNAVTDTLQDKAMQWRAEVLSEGSYDGDYLQTGYFKLYNEGWYAVKGAKRYISTDGTTGWKAADDSGTPLRLEMVTTKPEQLKMTNIVWQTYEHDQKQSPALGVVGSAPRSWSLYPDLPVGLIFSAETGVIAMEVGQDMPPVPRKEYTLTVSNAAGSTNTRFTLEIQQVKEMVVATEEKEMVVATA